MKKMEEKLRMHSVPDINKERIFVTPLPITDQRHHASHSIISQLSAVEYDRGRRRSTIHSYTLSNYHSLSHDPQTLKTVREMSESKALKNVIVLGFAFMFVHTAFVSLQGLQSTMNWEGGVGVVSLSCMYVSSILSCLLAPWIIGRLTTKWTMVTAFIFFTGYFAGNFHPEHYMLVPLAVILGLLGGPLWSAQATTLTSVALAYAEHSHQHDQDAVINKFMGIFCGLYRTSNIWGNLITTLVLAQNSTNMDNDFKMYNNYSKNATCGAKYCHFMDEEIDQDAYSKDTISLIPESTRIMLLSIYLGCGVMGIVILVSLLDQSKRSKIRRNKDDELSSKELFLATIKMLRDYKCQLLILMVIFTGLEQGFMFSDFTKVSQFIIQLNYISSFYYQTHNVCDSKIYLILREKPHPLKQKMI